MSMCAGKTMCEIYRDKKYCRKFEEKQGQYGVCDCRHAILPCDVDSCYYKASCRMKGETDIVDILGNEKGGK